MISDHPPFVKRHASSGTVKTKRLANSPDRSRDSGFAELARTISKAMIPSKRDLLAFRGAKPAEYPFVTQIHRRHASTLSKREE